MVLHLPLPIWQQIQCYVESCLPNEVTGIGAIHIIDPNTVEVTELFLPAQSVDAAYSQFDNGELGRIISKFVGNNPAHAGNLCFRWHSHGHSKVFWSGVDQTDIDRWKGNYVFNLVTNAAGDMLARLDYFKPLRVNNIPVTVQVDYPQLDANLQAQYRAEIAEKVKIIPPKIPTTGTEMDMDALTQILYKGGDSTHERLY